MADTLEELAARCESATGPDRELDLLITQQFDPEYAAIWPENFKSYVKYGAHPAYSSSLDAAMTLVPEGYVWGVGLWGNPDTDGPWAWCDTKQNSKDNDLDYGKASTPALALCAAALRAIAKERG